MLEPLSTIALATVLLNFSMLSAVLSQQQQPPPLTNGHVQTPPLEPKVKIQPPSNKGKMTPPSLQVGVSGTTSMMIATEAVLLGDTSKLVQYIITAHPKSACIL